MTSDGAFVGARAAHDPFAAGCREDPYPTFARLRAAGPLLYHADLGFWLATHHATVRAIMTDPASFSSAQGIGAARGAVRRPTLLTSDPPDHARLRSLVSAAFTPRRIAELEARVQGMVDALLDRALADAAFDLTGALAHPLPVAVVADILSVESTRLADFTRWSDAVIKSIAGLGDAQERARARQSYLEFDAYFGREIEARRGERRDDLLSALVTAQEERDALSTAEIINFCMLLFVAGNETTTNLITNAVLALFQHPEAAETLRAAPSLLPGALEEVLRCESPVQGIFRTTTREVAIGGVTLAPDQKVCMLLGAANRDAAVFADAERFDLRRAPNPHVAFGHSIHHCIGAPLARLEARVAISTLLGRSRDLRPDPSQPRQRVESPLVRGLLRFPVLATGE